MAYLIWCVAYADIEVLETLHGQRFLSRARNLGYVPRWIYKTSLSTLGEGSYR